MAWRELAGGGTGAAVVAGLHLVVADHANLYRAGFWQCPIPARSGCLITNDVALSRRFITRQGSMQVIKYAFEMAQKKGARRITCGHKANIMKLTDGLFLDAQQRRHETSVNLMVVDQRTLNDTLSSSWRICRVNNEPVIRPAALVERTRQNPHQLIADDRLGQIGRKTDFAATLPVPTNAPRREHDQPNPHCILAVPKCSRPTQIHPSPALRNREPRHQSSYDLPACALDSALASRTRPR